jgi:hypothetical protein
MEPISTPNSGNDQILTIAYIATLAPPNIIGPAAPWGTVGPCAIHNATMLVKKIAGNTAAIPAINGCPCPDSQTAKPMAIAAANPLHTKTKGETVCFPFAISVVFQFIITDNNISNNKPINPKLIADRFSSNAIPAIFNIIMALKVQINNAEIVVIVRGVFVCERCGGRIIHTLKKIPLTSIPSGIIAILSINAASPPTIYIPAAAGTIVDGTVPNIPPVIPPHFSIATVTKVATIPANRAEIKTDCPRIKSQPKLYL